MKAHEFLPTTQHPNHQARRLWTSSKLCSALTTAATWALILGLLGGCATASRNPTTPGRPHAIVLMTDFGEFDGAVSAMRGVAHGVAPQTPIYDLTHQIPPYDIWSGAYRLKQTVKYWPPGTVFVNVVDPGVGTTRKSVALETLSGHILLGPDNGLFTLVAEDLGLKRVVNIEESRQRLKGSEESYTFHGRDLYAYVGARVASGQVELEQLGERLPDVKRLDYQRAAIRGSRVVGMIPVLDPMYGNVWSNIPKSMVESWRQGRAKIKVVIKKSGRQVWRGEVPIVETFGGVPEGQALAYYNSLLDFSVALNMRNFAAQHKISSGPDWTIELE
ncbi:MAG TPA: S-adenosyl-l-methionine hydroxide adenosyltransferase family protein [Pseudobdellovibrionaceae bacterium]|nr:S-adenosyl-l-methionine hydroxide adenosyltransferase family protein [Pseudobdellovibrionaceae bacterium]